MDHVCEVGEVTFLVEDVDNFGLIEAIVLSNLRECQPISNLDLYCLMDYLKNDDKIAEALKNLAKANKIVCYHVASDPFVRIMLNPEYKKPKEDKQDT